MSFFSSKLSQSGAQDSLELSWKVKLGGKVANSLAAQHICMQMLVVTVPQRQPAVVLLFSLPRAYIDPVSPEAHHRWHGRFEWLHGGEQMITAGLSVSTLSPAASISAMATPSALLSSMKLC